MSFTLCGGAVHYYRWRGLSPARRAAAMAPLVFINGLGTDHHIWESVLEALPAELPALVYDQRGQGLSELGEGRADLERLSEDLRELLDELGADAVALCGFSLGGLIAQRFALSHPERVRALCLCATSPRIGSPELWLERRERVRRDGLAELAPSIVERWFSLAFAAGHPELVRGHRVLLQRSPAQGYMSGLSLLAEVDLTEQVARISAPTLVVAGELDVATPVAQLRGLAAAIGGAELCVLPGAGHLLGVEQPQALARALQGFLGGRGLV